MLCQTCETSLQAKFRQFKANPDADVLHHTPHSLYRSMITGCYICRRTWMSILETDAKGMVYLQPTFEGSIPDTYEEFSIQVRAIEGNTEQSCSGLHTTSQGIQDSSRDTQRIKESAKMPKSLLGTTPYVVFDVFLISPSNIHLIIIAKGTTVLSFNCRPVPTTIPENLSPKRLLRKVQCPASTAERPDLWRYWFHTCSTSHTRCRALERKQEPFIPDRLIQLEDVNGNGTKWRLVEKCRGDIDASISYLTLSHCWGSSEHLKLTKDNHSVFRATSSASKLPKTYQDAFQIATSLGFHFIWIDSLCIIQDQDDQDDWKTQSSLMGSIYGSARCNIAATWATDGSDGCFSLRDPCMVDPTTVKLRIEDQLVDWDLDIQGGHFHDVEAAPLNRRAWVFQERYLARKQLNFSKRQVYWECLELVASEQYPNGCSESPHLKKPSVEVKVEDDFPGIWRRLVETYSRCTLTRKSDKLIALAGLASEFQKVVEDEYLAGLWKRNFHKQLNWNPDLLSENHSRILPSAAPTWSWASIDGEVDMFHHLSGANIPLVQLIEVSVSTRDPGELYGFTPPKLTIRGLGAWARADVRKSTFKSYGTEYELQIIHQPEPTGSSTALNAEIVWDENISSRDVDPDRWDEYKEQREGILFMMWVTCDGRMPTFSQGLVLRVLPGSGSGHLFVRMGTFSSRDPYMRNQIATRLGIPCVGDDEDKDEDENDPLFESSVDLDDARLAGLIHTVTIM
ncbi:heterokaryon incompatibility protein-domain-containing protein [Hypoxylon cercidicola]|nr:heterokaryon incompatibility protein-domain-containing protein [Hypoxylon cercidicola]